MRISILILIAALGVSILTACNGSSYTTYQYLAPYEVGNAVETSEIAVAVDNETLNMQKYVVERTTTTTKVEKYDKVVISVVFEAFKQASSTTYTTSYKYSASSLTVRIGIDDIMIGIEKGLLANSYVGDKVRLMMPPELAYGANGAYISTSAAYLYPFAWYLADFQIISATKPESIPVHYDQVDEFKASFKDTVTLASGLKYIKCKTTTGRQAATGSNVTIKYTGYLPSGEIFDSNVTDSGTFAFAVGESVIAGMSEAVTHMRVGEKIRALIPNNLAYVAQSIGKIPPFSDLIFDIELKSVE